MAIFDTNILVSDVLGVQNAKKGENVPSASAALPSFTPKGSDSTAPAVRESTESDPEEA